MKDSTSEQISNLEPLVLGLSQPELEQFVLTVFKRLSNQIARWELELCKAEFEDGNCDEFLPIRAEMLMNLHIDAWVGIVDCIDDAWRRGRRMISLKTLVRQLTPRFLRHDRFMQLRLAWESASRNAESPGRFLPEMSDEEFLIEYDELCLWDIGYYVDLEAEYAKRSHCTAKPVS